MDTFCANIIHEIFKLNFFFLIIVDKNCLTMSKGLKMLCYYVFFIAFFTPKTKTVFASNFPFFLFFFWRFEKFWEFDFTNAPIRFTFPLHTTLKCKIESLFRLLIVYKHKKLKNRSL